jgi:hypothetical protein
LVPLRVAGLAGGGLDLRETVHKTPCEMVVRQSVVWIFCQIVVWQAVIWILGETVHEILCEMVVRQSVVWKAAVSARKCL